jgi:hypothetical protein
MNSMLAAAVLGAGTLGIVVINGFLARFTIAGAAAGFVASLA